MSKVPTPITTQANNVKNKFEIKNGYIHYEITDEKNLDDGRPVMFFLPGGPGFSYQNYLEAFRSLEQYCHIVYHDPRGCGLSSQFPIEEYTIDNNIADLECLRKHLNLKNIVVFGFSYGSMMALGYATQYASNISQLILAAGATSSDFIEKAKQNLREQGTQTQIDICDELLWKGNFSKEDDMLRFLKIVFPMYSMRVRSGELASPFDQAKFAPYSADPLNYAFQQNFFGFDYRTHLSNVTCPTLILAAKHDWINDCQYAYEMANEIPNSELVLFEQSGHSMLTDVKEEFLNKIKKQVLL